MERPYPVVEFEATVSPGGTIEIPPALAGRIPGGTAVTVRITEGVVSGSLRGRGISEDEVEQISRLQFEDRANVIEFLGAEGALAASKAFRRRTVSARRPR